MRAVGLTAQYLLQAIESRRGDVQLSDPELQHLLNEACQGRVRTTGARAPGDVLTMQDEREELQEAMEQYVGATKIEKDKSNLAQIYHNMGVIFHSQKDYAKAVEAYKESLRNNPKDDETRYNLALAQKQLQDQQQNQDQNQDQDKQDQQKEQDKQQDQQKDQQQNQDQQQQPSQPEKKDNEMSKENAEQLLNSVMQDEKDVQDKVKKQQVLQGGRLEKDW